MVDPTVVTPKCANPLPSIEPPAGIRTMVQTIWPDDAGERRVYLTVARNIQSFLGVRRLTSWADLDVEAFVSFHARTFRKAIQLCLEISGMLPWLVRSGELSRPAATRLWLDLYDVCPNDADALASIELTMEHLGDADVLAAMRGRAG